MDLSHPIRVVSPTLDGPVLEALAGTTRRLTGREVHRLTGIGSPTGVRLVLVRLVGQGIVYAEEHETAIFYIANRDHLAWPAIELLVGLRRLLIDRLRTSLDAWRPRPVHASLFGSMARGDGSVGSDIDLLLVMPDGTDEDESPWADQVDRIRYDVEAWTGNHCQAFQIDQDRLAEHVRALDPLVEEWRRDAITLVGPDVRRILRRSSQRGGGQ